jgi:hypothetical protein
MVCPVGEGQAGSHSDTGHTVIRATLLPQYFISSDVSHGPSDRKPETGSGDIHFHINILLL